MTSHCLSASLCLAVLTAGPALAQVQRTSPKGFTQTAGNAAFELGQIDLFGLPLTEGWTVIDGSWVGTPFLMRALSLRQSAAVEPDPASTKTTLKLHLRLGHVDLTQMPSSGPAQMSKLASGWVSMHAGTKIDFPDLSRAPNTKPAPWSLRIPLPRAFAYDGQQGLALQCYAEPASGIAPSFAFDGIDESRATSFGEGHPIGSGCQFRNSEIRLESLWTVYANTRRDAMLETLSLPSTTDYPNETLLLIGSMDPDLALGLCTRLHSSAELILPMNGLVLVSESQGYARSLTLRTPYHANLVGLRLYLQSWSIDRSQSPPGLVGSQGLRTGRFPARPMPSTQIRVATAGPTPSGYPDLVVLEANAGPIIGIE